MHDLVIRNGTVVDGTGADRRVADIAIDGELIVDVGEPGTLGDGRRLSRAGGARPPAAAESALAGG